jgi:hypothetical protein
MFGTLFQFRIAFKISALVRFFCGAARCTRLNINSGPFFTQAKSSPGAAPGSTTRFLLSAVNVIVGLSHGAHARSSNANFQSLAERMTYGKGLSDSCLRNIPSSLYVERFNVLAL